MRFAVPTILGLATLAAADSCVTSYSDCLDAGGLVNTCQSDNAKCKNVCADSYGSCLYSGADAAGCMTAYNACYDDFTVFSTAANSAGKDCVSLFSGCHDSGEADNTCNSDNAQCKDKCSTIYGTCLSSGGADSASCMTQYNNCLDSFSVFQTAAVSQNIDCVSMFSACHDSGVADNTCNSYNAQCKDKCSVIYGTCLSSGSADDAQCMNQYNNCFDSFTPSTSVDCVSEFTICLNNGGEANTCASYSAQCKDKCSVSYSTCLASGNANDAACLTQYTGCLVSFTPVANSTSCVTKYNTCENDGVTLDNECSAETAVCKTNCATSYSTCLSSGDSSVLAPCLTQYTTCLDDFSDFTANTTVAGEDCVSKYLACDGEDNTCSASNAQCKNSCSTIYDICNSSGDETLSVQCLAQYDSCLYDPTAVYTKPDCTSAYLSCDGDDNTCLATLAQCKNTCSVALDTCQTSGDSALDASCGKMYDACLFDKDAATAAIGEDCVGEYLDCEASGTADNTCNAGVAQCKNKCAQGYDTCNTSNNNSTAPACLRVYDSCLVSFSANETTAVGSDCVSKYTACGATGTADNVCNADYAQCKNTCATVLDTCSSSGDVTLLSMCDSLYNACLSPTLNTNITANSTEILNSTSTSTSLFASATLAPVNISSSAFPTTTATPLSTGVASAGSALPTISTSAGYYANTTSTYTMPTAVGDAVSSTTTLAPTTVTTEASTPTETGAADEDDGEGDDDEEEVDNGSCPA